MKPRLVPWLVPLLAVCWVPLHPSLAWGDSKYVGTSGTATSSGKATITIEPVSLTAQSPITVDVTVPSGSTAANTTLLMRDSLDVALSPDYVVTLANSTTVQINRTTGGFDMTVVDNVPGQVVQQTPPPLATGPVLWVPWGPPVLTLLLVVTVLVVLVRRGRRRIPRGDVNP